MTIVIVIMICFTCRLAGVLSSCFSPLAQVLLPVGGVNKPLQFPTAHPKAHVHFAAVLALERLLSVSSRGGLWLSRQVLGRSERDRGCDDQRAVCLESVQCSLAYAVVRVRRGKDCLVQ